MANHQDTFYAAFDADNTREPPLQLVISDSALTPTVVHPLTHKPEAYGTPQVNLHGGIHATAGDELVVAAGKLREALADAGTTVFSLEPQTEDLYSELNLKTGRRIERRPVSWEVVSFLCDEVGRQARKATV